MDKLLFSEWLLNEIKKREWSQAVLAKKSGVSPQAISNYINDLRRKPDEESLAEIARALGYPPEIVYDAAGIQITRKNQDIDWDEWRFVLSKLSDTDRAELMEIARGKLERTNETWNVIVDGIWQLPQEERDRILKDQAEIIKETLYKIGGRRDK